VWCVLCWLLYDCMVAEADPNLRDWSGRKPRQYQPSQDTSVSADTFRSEYLSDRLSRVRLSTNPSPAANNTHPKIRKSIYRHSFLRKSLLPSDHRKRRHTKFESLYEWLSHVTGIVNLSGLLLLIMEVNERPCGMENITLSGNAVDCNTYNTRLCVLQAGYTNCLSVCLSFTNLC
jgi:hypothetical protein